MTNYLWWLYVGAFALIYMDSFVVPAGMHTFKTWYGRVAHTAVFAFVMILLITACGELFELFIRYNAPIT